MSHHVNQILGTHPSSATIDRQALTDAIDTITSCADTCTACADACLAEDKVADLRRCIRLNLDCADACRSTAAMLLRQTEPDVAVLRAAVEACEQACRSCGDECDKHAEMHEHCRVCAEACRQCADACRQLLGSLG